MSDDTDYGPLFSQPEEEEPEPARCECCGQVLAEGRKKKRKMPSWLKDPAADLDREWAEPTIREEISRAVRSIVRDMIAPPEEA